MNKKLKWLIVTFIAILISSHILVKAVIWFSSSLKQSHEHKILSPIIISQKTPWQRYRYTNEQKQKLFNKVDFLLTPAFILLFTVIAVRLVKVPQIFQEES